MTDGSTTQDFTTTVIEEEDSTDAQTRLGWTHRILDTRIWDDYLDLANTMLHVQVKVTRTDGVILELSYRVGQVNNWLHSRFSQVDVYLNGTLVTPSINRYAYRAYIETLLSYGTYANMPLTWMPSR